MKHYSDPAIPARSPDRRIVNRSWKLARVAACFAALALGATGQTALQRLSTTYRSNPSAENRAALLKFSSDHPRDTEGALALFALAQADFDAGRLAEVPARMAAAQARLAKLADYAAFASGSALQSQGQDDAAMKALAPVWTMQPKSPFLTRGLAAFTKSAARTGQSSKALELLKRFYNDLQQPAGDLALAEAFEGSNDFVSAANYYQRVYTTSPESREAVDAEAALGRLRTQLGASYPPITPAAGIARASRLLELGYASRARRDFETLQTSVAGPEKETVQVRIGGAMLRAGDARGAEKYLASLRPAAGSEANAERLFYLTRCAVRLDDAGNMMRQLDQLARGHAKSKWRMEALIAAGDYYFLKLKPGSFGPIYEQCGANFRTEERAGICHWRAALAAYQANRAAAADLFQAHIRNSPGEEHVAGSLFHLGQIAEKKQDWGTARVLYQDIDYSYPNYYYAFLARERFKDSRIVNAAPSATAAGFLANVAFPKRRFVEDFRPSSQSVHRTDRARMLSSAALDTLAEMELRFGAKNDAQPHLMAMELASIYTAGGRPSQGVRAMKSLATNYLKMPIETAPREFWKYLFPLPWRASLELYAKESGVDPFLVAGLIRQESEFDHSVVSHSNAHGLMQIMPATGVELNRQIGLQGYSRMALFDPATNLKLGTYYLNRLFKTFDQKWEETLASYNAGPGRVRGWLGSMPPSTEPWEWVETIPFNETRGYVQSVLRNADTYRKLYGNTPGDSTPAPPIESLKPALAPRAPAAKSPAKPGARPATKSATGSRRRRA